MTDQHPITLPPELVEQWRSEPEYGTPGRVTLNTISEQRLFQLLTRAAEWGADQELEACCKWTTANFGELPGQNLHLFRRPKPQSLKERALEEVGVFEGMGICNIDIIRRALEAIPDD
jgi:hypothetical protein